MTCSCSPTLSFPPFCGQGPRDLRTPALSKLLPGTGSPPELTCRMLKISPSFEVHRVPGLLDRKAPGPGRGARNVPRFLVPPPPAAKLCPAQDGAGSEPRLRALQASTPATALATSNWSEVVSCNFEAAIGLETESESLSRDEEDARSCEANFCGWSNGDNAWRPRSGSTPSSDTGPEQAAEGDWYVYVESSSNANKAGLFNKRKGSAPEPGRRNARQEFILTSGIFDTSPATRHLHFYFHMFGRHLQTGSLRMDALRSSGWTQVWSRIGEQGTQWGTALVSLPQDAAAVRFVGITGDSWRSDIGLDGIATGLPTVEFDQLTCEFGFDTCLWQSTGASSWQLAGDADGQWLEAVQSGSQASQWILETAALFNTTEEKALVFDYQLNGSGTVALELQHQASAGDWQRLWMQSGSRGAGWHAAIVTIPSSTVSLRLLANVTDDADVVRIDSLHAADVLHDWSSISCGFESDFCAWSTSSHPWLRGSGTTPSSGTGPDEAAEGESYIYTEASDNENKEFILTSDLFDPSPESRHLHFHYHMQGADTGSLRMDALRSSGWTQVWSRIGEQGTQWGLAQVMLPQDARAVRFVGITGDSWRSDVALDGIATGLPDPLTCEFSVDTCGKALLPLPLHGSLRGTRMASGWRLCRMEKALVFDYQLNGSGTVALELQHQASAGGWQRLWMESGSRGAGWHTAAVTVPFGTVSVRFVANVSEPGLVKLDSFLVTAIEPALANSSCSFEETCKWMGDWQRRSSPFRSLTTAFQAESYAYAGGSGTVGGKAGRRGQSLFCNFPPCPSQTFVLTSPLFPKIANVSYLEFAFYMYGSSVGKLELWYLRNNMWSLRWSRQSNQGNAWLQAKVTLPSGVEMLRFVSSGALSEFSHVALDAILAWEGPEAAPAEFLSLSSGNWHNCAVLQAEGLLKCWGVGDHGRLLSGSDAEVGLAPGQMGEKLPAVDLGEPGVRVTQVTCGVWHTCALLETGFFKCFGSGTHGKLGNGHTRHVGDEPLEMGAHLPAVDLGPGVEVVQVDAGRTHTCALLRGGSVKCFGEGRLLGLGDERGPQKDRGDEPGEMGSNLTAIDLGTDFEAAVQLALGDYHSCALSSQGTVKCWGRGDRLGLGLPAVGIGNSPNEMGNALPAVDLGPLPAAQIAAGSRHTCVLSDGSAKCWGANHRGQLGHGSLEDAGDEPGEMGTSLPVVDLGDGMTVVRITAGSHYSCAILQDASLKCWGSGVSGQPGPQWGGGGERLGQGNLESLGDEPSEMGSNLRAVGLGNLEVRDVSAGSGHTCVLLEDDSTRCWGEGSLGQLGTGSALSVGQVPGELGVALVPAELFPRTLGAGLQGLSLLAVAEDHGFAKGLLQLQHNASVGLVCDDDFDSRVAQVACRDLGMAGGRTLPALAMWGWVGAGTILADNIQCTGAEVSLRDCLECESDAWSEYTPAASPAGRQDASMVWDSETQSAWMFGGHASNAFLYFADLWRYDWSRRAWTEILPLNEGSTPGSRWGHAAVWDAHSRSMLIFGGRFRVAFYDDIWQFRSTDSTWRQLPTMAKPSARAYHSAILDPVEGAVLVFGGESSSQVLEDLQRYSLADGQWSKSGATGLGARSRHTAVWVPATRSMLVFGGWSGQQYLDDLCSYDASAGTWTDLSASGYWPTARAGHAAAWDPISMSMLVMGGITSVSDELSYESSLYNYSLLTNSWKQEGLQSEVPGPTGRTGHGIVWDDAARGLLTFGGFNASYLQQTWRYVVSQTSSPLLVSCQQGRNCSFRWNASGLGTVKRSCSDPEVLTGLGLPTPLSEAEEDLWMFGGHASPFFVEPGHHRLCWCDVVNCSHPDNFSVTVGYFVLEGPQLQQSAQCYLGRDCRISEWRGVGISANDSVVMQSRCGEGPRLSSSTYSQRSVGVSFNESYGWHTLHVGFLDPAEGLKPEALELCWCPAAAAPCASAEDFLVVALSLDVICPPGEYSEGPGSSCLLCPPNFFCPAVRNCRAVRRRALRCRAQVRQLSECLCLQGRYWDAESAICLACPAGSSTLQEGATSLASCTCMPGFFATQPDNPAVCEACGVGFFCAGGLQTPQPCAPSQTTESDTSADESKCVCRAGSFLEDGLCAPCPVGFFKGSVGDFPCSPCGTGTFSNGTGSTEPCRCQQGYGFDEEIAQCRPCLPGEYKALVGDTPCSRCSTNKTSMEGAASPLDCRCRSGLAAEGESCRDCREGFFCQGQGEERRCQDDATSRRGSILQADCLCLPGYYSLEAQGLCEPCEPGRYKPTLANDPSCPLQCPTNGESANASTNLTECFCMPGFYAVLDEGSLSRCASCAFLPHLQCLGGFHTQAGITQLGNHKLPVARPGYFQTGVTIAVKCTAVTSTGLSACLGGQLCAQDDTVECFGKYDNACDEGSTGFFCGECPAGWARSAFQQPCEPCAAGAVLPLVASVIIDVGTKVAGAEQLPNFKGVFAKPPLNPRSWPQQGKCKKREGAGHSGGSGQATINFVVAAMAAMAAVRASSKLHTVMIRIAVQWLAACSVLTAFDLTQIPLENDVETQRDQEEHPLFPWPAQVSAAMRGLFETLTLTPVLTSVNSATQCFAQELAPDSTAPRIAFGVYHLALPLLVMIGILLLSFVVVHVVVPLGQRFGFSFNESGRSMNHLRKIIDPMLKEILRKPVAEASITTSRTSDAFAWADLERAGTLGNLTTAQLQQAAENPDGFLRTAAAGSRELLVSACAARAAQLHPQAEAQELYQELAKADLRQFLTADFATRSPDFTAMLDKVLDAAFTFDEETVPVPKEGPEQEEADELRLVGSEHAPCDVVVALPTDAMPEKKPGEKSTFSFTSLDNRASPMDSLNCGLFSPAPRFGELAYQSVPIIWVSLVSLWPGLLSSFLQMIWCVSVLEDDVLVSRLLPNPSVICWSDEHLVSARFAIAGLVVWCLGIPIVLATVLFRLPDRQAPDNFRRFGYFFQGLERQFWWWDLLVKRFDLALMMLVAYTSLVPDQKAKLALFPVLSAFQALLASWVRPYANDQAEVLDVLEVTLCSIRFLLFSGVALLLSLETPTETAHMVAYLLLLVLVLACLYFFAHFTAQVLQDAAAWRSVGWFPRFVIELALPLFTEAQSESLELVWSFSSEEITATTASLDARNSGQMSKTALGKICTKAWHVLRQLSKAVLRHGPLFQQAAVAKANDDLLALWLQLGPKLPSQKHACALATACKALPRSLVKSRICVSWMQQLEVLSQQDPPFRCSPKDLEQAVQQLGKLSSEDGSMLIEYVVTLCDAHIQPEALLEF
ncbi:unnamed protein product [Symbiodinium sp. CCMP2592]|nr:unnamed protein product [Symbiodinium sp. CCMP2592]